MSMAVNLTESTKQPASQDVESELLQGIVDRDSRSLERLIQVYGPRVMSVARRYLHDEADVADCFQDTFLSVFKNIEQFEQRSSLATWIRSIAVNQCLMKLRKTKRRREESIDDLLPTFDESGRRVMPSGRTSRIEESLDRQSAKELVRKSIDRLPESYRTVILLRDIDGRSTKETARLLEVEINTVKTRLHRARSALRTLLEPVIDK